MLIKDEETSHNSTQYTAESNSSTKKTTDRPKNFGNGESNKSVAPQYEI